MKKVETLEAENHTLLQQLAQLQALVARTTNPMLGRPVHLGTCLMVSHMTFVHKIHVLLRLWSCVLEFSLEIFFLIRYHLHLTSVLLLHQVHEWIWMNGRINGCMDKLKNGWMDG